MTDYLTNGRRVPDKHHLILHDRTIFHVSYLSKYRYYSPPPHVTTKPVHPRIDSISDCLIVLYTCTAVPIVALFSLCSLVRSAISIHSPSVVDVKFLFDVFRNLAVGVMGGQVVLFPLSQPRPPVRFGDRNRSSY